MALDKVLKIYDEQGNPVDYDILASDVKFEPDGKDLPTKLNEMQDAIDEAASQGGIQQETDPTVPAWAKRSTPPTPQEIGAVPAQGYVPLTQSERDKLDNLPTADQLTQQLGNKANSNEVIKSITVNGQAQQKDQNGNVNISVDGGSVESVTVNGTKHTPDVNGDVDLGIVQGEKGDKGDKGDTGNVEITDASEIVTIIQNNLDSSNGNDILSARQGKILKQVINTVNGNIQALVNALANLAFAGERPTLEALDWTGGTFYADFTLQLTGVSIVSQTATNGKQVEHQNYQLVIATDNGYTIDNDSVIEVTNRGQAVQHTFANNTLTIADVFGSYVIRIAATANFFSVQVPSAVANQLDVLDENGDPFSSNTVIIDKSGSSLAFQCTVKPALLYSCDVEVMMGNVDVTATYYTQSTGVVNIPQVTGDVVISVSNLQSYNPMFKNVLATVANTGYNTIKVLSKDADTADGFLSPLVNLGYNTKVTFSTGLPNKSIYILFYDDNGEYMTSFRQNSDPRTVDIPSGAKYARLASISTSLANCYFTGDDTQVRLWDGVNESLSDAASAREFLESRFGPKTDAYGSILHADMDGYQIPGVKYNGGPLADEHLSFPERVITREIVLPEISGDGNRKITFWSGLTNTTVFMVYDGDGHVDAWTQQGNATSGREVNLVGDIAYAKYARMVVPLASYYDFANSPLWVKDANGNVLWSNEGISEEENNGND